MSSDYCQSGIFGGGCGVKMAQRYHFDAAEVGINRRRKEVASKNEIEFRLAKLNWYLRRLVEWAKLTHDFCDGPIAASSAVSSEQASLLLP
jgi:hypothetical protein